MLVLSLIIAAGAAGQQPEQNLRTSNFNQNWLKTLVSIELVRPGGPVPVGTGFLVSTPDQRILLVTARHVVLGEDGKAKANLAYRLNETGGTSRLYGDAQVTALTTTGWFVSASADVACRYVVMSKTADALLLPQDAFLPRKGLQPGAPLLVPGFPLQLRSEKYASPLVRHGIVARSDDEGIIIDAFAFPGNSGGPVFYVPLLFLGPGLRSGQLNEQKVAGLVSFNISYVERAVSEQSRRARVTFEENTGLTSVVPADAILELLRRDDVVKAASKIPN